MDFAKAGVRVDGQGLGLQDRGKGYKIRIGMERLRLGLEYMNSNWLVIDKHYDITDYYIFIDYLFSVKWKLLKNHK